MPQSKVAAIAIEKLSSVKQERRHVETIGSASICKLAPEPILLSSETQKQREIATASNNLYQYFYVEMQFGGSIASHKAAIANECNKRSPEAYFLCL